jgi:hypothetical protein
MDPMEALWPSLVIALLIGVSVCLINLAYELYRGEFEPVDWLLQCVAWFLLATPFVVWPLTLGWKLIDFHALTALTLREWSIALPWWAKLIPLCILFLACRFVINLVGPRRRPMKRARKRRGQ